MKLNLDLAFGRDCFSGVAGVTGVATKKDKGETRNTSFSRGVTGVANCPAQLDLQHLATPPKSEVLQETANVDEAATLVTPDTPRSKLFPEAPLPAEHPAPVSDPPIYDTDAWEEDFSEWALARCVFRDGCLGGVAALEGHFSTWCAERGWPGLEAASFRALLAREGFTVTERGMVEGLLLREDWEAAHQPAPPSTASTTAQTRSARPRGNATAKQGGPPWTR